MPARTEEADWIRAAQRGDGTAFERLVRAYDAAVLRMAYNLLRSEDDARDIYQEAFLRVYRNLGQFRFDCAFSTWLYRIVANLCLDQLRKRKVRREEPVTISSPEGERNLLETIAENRPGSDPQRQLLDSEVRARVADAMETLTARERVVFEMRHFGGMRLRAIGESLGITEEAAKNCLFRATQKMRAATEELL